MRSPTTFALPVVTMPPHDIPVFEAEGRSRCERGCHGQRHAERRRGCAAIGPLPQVPLEQLSGFERVSIPRGQTRTVHLPLKASALAYWDETRNGWVAEAGPVEVFVGGSSADERLSTFIPVVE
jgi:hypothetical protein